jgi:hypothetical protein
MIQIVTHVYAGNLPQYAVFLRAHLTSVLDTLLDTKNPVDAEVTICFTPEDTLVTNVLKDFKPFFGYGLQTINYPKTHLFRRAIGRNMAALTSNADLIWFADVDHVFGPGCLHALHNTHTDMQAILPPTVMRWPSTIQIHRDHLIGDAWWQANAKSTGKLQIDTADFETKQYAKAIGGVQICDGNYCREHGYLKGFDKWLKPVPGDKPFPNFRDDVKFRKKCESDGPTSAIELPNLFRLRHSETSYQ